MKNALIDTNVVLDFALGREHFLETAQRVFQTIHSNNINAFVSATSITDIYYVLRKSDGHPMALNFLVDFLKFVDVADVKKEVVLAALTSKFSDFEDAIQNECALKNEIEIIITRNQKDFKESVLTVLLPEEFLEKFRK
jgi:predicted nucleic acid-binding protein